MLQLLEDERITPEQLAELRRDEPPSRMNTKGGERGLAKQDSEGDPR